MVAMACAGWYTSHSSVEWARRPYRSRELGIPMAWVMRKAVAQVHIPGYDESRIAPQQRLTERDDADNAVGQREPAGERTLIHVCDKVSKPLFANGSRPT